MKSRMDAYQRQTSLLFPYPMVLDHPETWICQSAHLFRRSETLLLHALDLCLKRKKTEILPKNGIFFLESHKLEMIRSWDMAFDFSLEQKNERGQESDLCDREWIQAQKTLKRHLFFLWYGGNPFASIKICVLWMIHHENARPYSSCFLFCFCVFSIHFNGSLGYNFYAFFTTYF